MSKEEERKNNREIVESLGFEYGGDIIPDTFEADRRVFKVNLPELNDDVSWRSGNGEGCWCYLKKEEDYEKYDKGEGEFEVILLNPSFYYMNILNWGTVIMAVGRGSESRPVLKRDWITSHIERLSSTDEPDEDTVTFTSDKTE